MSFCGWLAVRWPRFGETRRERFLTDVEFRRLGDVLDEMEADGSLPVYPTAAIRLLMLTGCRRNEIVQLAWKNIDLEGGELRLQRAKTGSKFPPWTVEPVQPHAYPN